MSILLDGCPNSIICHYKGGMWSGAGLSNFLWRIHKVFASEKKLSKDCSIRVFGLEGSPLGCILWQITLITHIGVCRAIQASFGGIIVEYQKQVMLSCITYIKFMTSVCGSNNRQVDFFLIEQLVLYPNFSVSLFFGVKLKLLQPHGVLGGKPILPLEV